MYKLFKDASKQSPGNDISDEQFLISNVLRDFDGFKDGLCYLISLPLILNSFNKRGSFRNATLLLSCITNLCMEGALGRDEASWSHPSISIVTKAGRRVGKFPRNHRKRSI